MWINGTVYKGKWKNGLRHDDGKPGTSTIVYPDGRMYKGNFEEGARTGQGKFTYDGGKLCYEGAFRDGNFEGWGRMLYSDGTVDEGDWQNGDKQGQFTERNAEGEVSSWS